MIKVRANTCQKSNNKRSKNPNIQGFYFSLIVVVDFEQVTFIHQSTEKSLSSTNTYKKVILISAYAVKAKPNMSTNEKLFILEAQRRLLHVSV